MLKNISKLEIAINEKSYQLLCDMDSPLQDVKEAVFQFQKYIGKIEDQVKEQQDKLKAQEESKKEESKVTSIEAEQSSAQA